MNETKVIIILFILEYYLKNDKLYFLFRKKSYILININKHKLTKNYQIKK